MEKKGTNYTIFLQLFFCLLLKCGAVDGQNERQPGRTGNGESQVCDPLLQYLFGTCGQWPFPTSPLPISSVPSPPPPRGLERPRRHVVPPPPYTVSPPGSPPSPLHVPSSPPSPYVPLPPSRPLLPYLSPPLSRSSMQSPPPPPYVPLPPLPPMPFLSNISPPPLPADLPTASAPPPPYVTLPPLPMPLLPNFSPGSPNFPSLLPSPFRGPAPATVQFPPPYP